MSAGLSGLLPALNWFVPLAPLVAVVVLVHARVRYRELPRSRRRRLGWLDLGTAWSLLAIATITGVPDDPPATGIERGLQLRPFSSILQVISSSVDGSVPIRVVRRSGDLSGGGTPVSVRARR